MDLVMMAGMAATALAPYLKDILKSAGDTATEEAGQEGYGLAKSLAAKLLPSGDADIITLGLAEECAKAPDDADALKMLELRFKKLMAENDALKAAVEKLLAEAQAKGATGGVGQTVKGNRNIVIGGNVTGGAISTGDGKTS